MPISRTLVRPASSSDHLVHRSMLHWLPLLGPPCLATFFVVMLDAVASCDIRRRVAIAMMERFMYRHCGTNVQSQSCKIPSVLLARAGRRLELQLHLLGALFDLKHSCWRCNRAFAVNVTPHPRSATREVIRQFVNISAPIISPCDIVCRRGSLRYVEVPRWIQDVCIKPIERRLRLE